MNHINNMGGILFADILYKSEISLFAVHQDIACIRIEEDYAWHNLPTIGIIEAPTVTPDETNSGTLYKHSITIRFSRAVLNQKEANDLRNKIVGGCILRCQDTNGNKYIYGALPYLLFGTLNKVIGKKTTDFTGYELKLSGTSLYPMLQYRNI